MSTTKIFINFNIYIYIYIEDEWIYIIQDIKSLLIRELERFYLPLKDPKEFFQNDL